MKASARSVVMILSLNVLALACGQRSNDTPTLGTNLPSQKATDDRSADLDRLERLIREQNDALAKLSTDKSSLQDRVNTYEAQIKSLNEQLSTNKTLSDAQRTEMEKKLSELQTQKADAEKQLATLQARNAELEKSLSDAKAENERLRKELEAAKTAGTATPASTTTTTTSNTTTTTSTGKFWSFRYADPAKVKNDCLVIPAGSTADNVQVDSDPCLSTSMSQHFGVVDPAQQFFTIKPRLSGKCLTVASAAEGAAVVQKTCTNTNDQSWEFFVRGAAEFRLRNQFSGKCMKIQADGKIIQGDCTTNATYFTWSVAG